MLLSISVFEADEKRPLKLFTAKLFGWRLWKLCITLIPRIANLLDRDSEQSMSYGLLGAVSSMRWEQCMKERVELEDRRDVDAPING